MPSAENIPGGWKGGPSATISRESTEVHRSPWAVRIERDLHSSGSFSRIVNCVQMDFVGKTIILRAFLRTQNVDGHAELWMREDADGGAIVALNEMPGHDLHGTTGWARYSISLPRKMRGERLYFGVALSGTGKVWISRLQLLVDGKPIWKAQKYTRPKMILDTDHQFDNGSGITINKLGKIQINNLITLGKVWGFLKYYDPEVTSGHQQWDFDLFRILPTILDAPNRSTANTVLAKWIKGLGPVARCNPCPHPNKKNLQMQPDLSWIADEHRLGKALSQELRWIHENHSTGKQFYVTLAPEGGNPVFKHELPYREIRFPDAGFQLLALYRYWNVIEYWYPYRNVMGENWDKVLAKFIPRLALARTRTSYERQLMALIAKIHDTHANLWSSIEVRPPVGKCHIPVRLHFIQDQPVVTRYMEGQQASTSPLQIGDVITRLDGETVSTLVKKWTPYYGASNKAALHREIATFMTRGTCGEAALGIRRDGHPMRVEAKRVPWPANAWNTGTLELPGPTFRLLSPKVGYLKISSAKPSKMARYIKQAADTEGLIIDLRGYPSFGGLMPGQYLINHPTPYSRFTVGDLTTPGAFFWTSSEYLTPHKPHYTGKVVILVDSFTQSYAEFTSMDLRAAGATVIGSTTAGADGDISRIRLPGGLFTVISGIGVFYPDHQPTQRIGIIPDIVVRPTITDIRDGRDPVLEKAIRLILGPKTPLSEIERMYMRQPARSSNTGTSPSG